MTTIPSLCVWAGLDIPPFLLQSKGRSVAAALAGDHPANRMNTTILVTGGAGFIGSNFILQWLAGKQSHVVNLDKLTYAGNPTNLASVASNPRYSFVQGDIADRDLVGNLLREYRMGAWYILPPRATSTGRFSGRTTLFARTSTERSALLEAARAYCGLNEPGAR